MALFFVCVLVFWVCFLIVFVFVFVAVVVVVVVVVVVGSTGGLARAQLTVKRSTSDTLSVRPVFTRTFGCRQSRNYTCVRRLCVAAL